MDTTVTDQPATKTAGDAVEMCLVITGHLGKRRWRVTSFQSGGETLSATPCSVEIQPRCLTDWSNRQVDQIVGTYHTHPNMPAVPSARDDRTMKAWVLSLGRPLVALIDGSDGLRAWWYLDDERPPVQAHVECIGSIPYGELPDELVKEGEGHGSDRAAGADE